MNPLVHCAQGKSRSGVICIGFLALIKPTVTVEDLAKEVKSRRGMPPKTSKLRTSKIVYDSLPERNCGRNINLLQLCQLISKLQSFVCDLICWNSSVRSKFPSHWLSGKLSYGSTLVRSSEVFDFRYGRAQLWIHATAHQIAKRRIFHANARVGNT
jgi:hypothetical protein